jgi:hypothetical protein
MTKIKQVNILNIQITWLIIVMVKCLYEVCWPGWSLSWWNIYIEYVDLLDLYVKYVDLVDLHHSEMSVLSMSTWNRSTYLIYTLTMTKINQVNIPNINISPWRRSTMSTYLSMLTWLIFLMVKFLYWECWPGWSSSWRKSVLSILTWLVFLVVKCLY